MAPRWSKIQGGSDTDLSEEDRKKLMEIQRIDEEYEAKMDQQDRDNPDTIVDEELEAEVTDKEEESADLTEDQ